MVSVLAREDLGKATATTPVNGYTLTAPDGTTTPEGSVTVTGDNTYASPTVTATEAGTYTWHASYSGDAYNNAASDQGGTSEQVTVSPASPTITTTPSVTNVTLGTTAPTLKDTTDLEGGYSPTGTITFTLYQGSILVDTETATVSGNGMYTTPTGYTLPTTGTVTGSYQWDPSYNGDGNNNTVSDTNNANEQVVVSPASPMITATASPSSITLNSTGPQVLSDSATLSGGYYPSGNISFTLFGPNDDIVYTTHVAVPNTNTYNASYTLPTNAVAGAYDWVVSYNGDANNNLATYASQEPTMVYKASPILMTVASP